MDELIIRYLQGMADDSETRELAEWRASSPDNETRFRDWQRIWARTQPLLADLSRVDLPTVQDLLAASSGEAPPLARPALPVRAAEGWDARRGGDDRARAAAAASATKAAGRSARRWILFLHAAAAAGICLLAFSIGRMSMAPRPGAGGAELITSAGERATIELGDGSVVRLGPESRLRLGADPAGRQVWVDGRAFFAIAKKDGEPFRVRTRMGDVMVLGTRFELQARQRTLQVVVVEGSVAIGSGDRAVKVDAGEVGRVIDGAEAEVVETGDVLRRLDWAGDFLAFQHTPLSQVAVEVGRRFGAEVIIADSALLHRTVSGWYVGGSFRQTIEAICLVIGAHCTIEGNTARVDL